MDPRDYLNILHMAERLKDTIRHCTTSKRREESVAEHSWRVSLMAFLLKDEFPDVNMDKVVDMCLIHDLGECFTGDIPAFVKTDSDREVEDSLLDEWVGSLPKEVSENMSSLYKEMDAQITKEAKIYKHWISLKRLYSIMNLLSIPGLRMSMSLIRHMHLIQLRFRSGLQI